MNIERKIVKTEDSKKFISDLETLSKEDIIDCLSYFYDMNVLEIDTGRKSIISTDQIVSNVKETNLNFLKILIKHKLCF